MTANTEMLSRDVYRRNLIDGTPILFEVSTFENKTNKRFDRKIRAFLPYIDYIEGPHATRKEEPIIFYSPYEICGFIFNRTPRTEVIDVGGQIFFAIEQTTQVFYPNIIDDIVNKLNENYKYNTEQKHKEKHVQTGYTLTSGSVSIQFFIHDDIEFVPDADMWLGYTQIFLPMETERDKFPSYYGISHYIANKIVRVGHSRLNAGWGTPSNRSVMPLYMVDGISHALKRDIREVELEMENMREEIFNTLKSVFDYNVVVFSHDFSPMLQSETFHIGKGIDLKVKYDSIDYDSEENTFIVGVSLYFPTGADGYLRKELVSHNTSLRIKDDASGMQYLFEKDLGVPTADGSRLLKVSFYIPDDFAPGSNNYAKGLKDENFVGLYKKLNKRVSRIVSSLRKIYEYNTHEEVR